MSAISEFAEGFKVEGGTFLCLGSGVDVSESPSLGVMIPVKLAALCKAGEGL